MSKSRREHGRPSLHLPLRTLATSNTLSPAFGFGNFGPFKMNSPMSNLAINLSELSTGRGTPRRKLSLSSTDTPSSSCHPTPERMSSTESGCFVDSPTPLDSPTLEMSMHRFAKNIKPDIPPEAFTKKKTIAFRRIQSMPLPMMRLSPIDFSGDMDKENEKRTLTFSDLDADNSSESLDTDQEVTRLIRPKFFSDENSSQDSGVDLERDGRDEFQFAAPIGVPPRNKMKIINEDTCSPHKYSPVKYLTDSNSDSPSRPRSKSVPVTGLDFSGANIRPMEESDSPLKFNRLLSHDDEDVDDGFLDCMDSEIAQINDNYPDVSDTMASLFSAPVVNEDRLASRLELEEEEETPVIKRSNRRLLNRSQSYDVRSRLNSNKREPPTDDSTPTQSKRRRSIISTSSPVLEEETHKTQPKPKLYRCQSETEAVIKSALNRIATEPDLIGDCSKPYCLPTISGKHQDLKGIAPETMVGVLNNDYDQDLEKYIVIDCRYPYEFDGGHIKDAKNIYTKEGIIEEFIKKPITSDSNKRVVLIFHCEFSSERGPSLLRFLRKMDRDVNKECYPALHYPELYLLEGGYKLFYQDCKDHCEPRSYKPMLHKDHTTDYRHFRAKSKSWAGEKAGRTGFRPLKF
ncbi:M-phase inducer phosphatase 1-like isoform X1 [Mizuhopecten yessoensis]|uniref:M-phase inducer phosphatase n=1 Tax=Mizuhopecten yessoensis TaxID=6573 RepID=A0A210QPX4_MIZYE|nr:M-phase inducer phosphatase 1-like isoform X1 [Mizuhopecten yessoensis]OWF50794.1 M-phase inducer phosphatase 1 [Mizuhopecten yessoensis]